MYMDDGSTVDASGNGRPMAHVGTPDWTSTPLVSGAYRSRRHNASSHTYMYSNIMQRGQERESFSIETWFVPSENTYCAIASHLGSFDGLWWQNGNLYFSLRLETQGYVIISYTPDSWRSMHSVGVFTGNALELWVNGDLKARQELTADQLSDQYFNFPTSPDYLLEGAGPGCQQATAFYKRALPPYQIKAHYLQGIRTTPASQASGMFGGIPENVSAETSNILMSMVYENRSQWETGTGVVTYGEEISSPLDPNGLPLEGEWVTTIPLSSDTTVIDHVFISWEKTGTVAVETKLDNGLWVPQNNYSKISSTNDINPTGKVLFVKLKFAAGVQGNMRSLRLRVFKDLSIRSLNRTITTGTDFTLYDKRPVMAYDSATDVSILNDPLIIGADQDAQTVQSLSFWYRATSGTLAVNKTPTTYYQNGAATTVNTRLNEWVFATYVFPATATDIQFTGTAVIKEIALYKEALTATQVDEIFRAYTSIPRFVVNSSSTVAVGAPSSAIYANNWSITAGG